MPSNRLSVPILKRLGIPRVEYVNRAGVPVDSKTGKPLTNSKLKSQKKTKRILPIKKKGVMLANLCPILTNPTVDPPPRVCFNCWQPGHSRIKCPRPVVSKFCYNCGRRGQEIESCPRCKDAYQLHVESFNGLRNTMFVDEHMMEREDEREVEEESLIRNLTERDDRARELQYEDQGYKRELGIYEEALRGDVNKYEVRHLSSTNKTPDQIRDVSPQPRSTSRYPRWYEKETIRYDSRNDVDESRYRDRSSHIRFEDEKNGGSSHTDRDYSRYLENREHSNKYYDKQETYDRNSYVKYPDSQEHGIRLHHDDRNHGFSLQSSSVDCESRELEHHPVHCDYYEEKRYSDDKRVTESPARVPSSSGDDPVHEILELARTISHLSPETQDMIMRQVMAERREKARLRESKILEEKQWP